MPAPTRPQLVGYALAALVVVVLGVRFMHGQASAERAPSAAAGGGEAVGAEGAPTAVRLAPRAPVSALVHVAGAVQRPGVYRLAEGKRVEDAIERAGGPRRGADLNAINLAAKVADGQQVVVPRRGAVAAAPGGAATASAGGATAAQAPVSLNSATAEQLDTLDGVGPATAQKILDWRQQHGGFQSVDDLAEVPGIGPKRLAALRPKVQL